MVFNRSGTHLSLEKAHFLRRDNKVVLSCARGVRLWWEWFFISGLSWERSLTRVVFHQLSFIRTKDHSDEKVTDQRPLWWKTTRTKDHSDEKITDQRPLWWKTTRVVFGPSCLSSEWSLVSYLFIRVVFGPSCLSSEWSLVSYLFIRVVFGPSHLLIRVSDHGSTSLSAGACSVNMTNVIPKPGPPAPAFLICN